MRANHMLSLRICAHSDRTRARGGRREVRRERERAREGEREREPETETETEIEIETDR